MTHLERLIDLRNTTAGKVVSTLMSILLVISMTNILSTISYAWADEPETDTAMTEPVEPVEPGEPEDDQVVILDTNDDADAGEDAGEPAETEEPAETPAPAEEPEGEIQTPTLFGTVENVVNDLSNQMTLESPMLMSLDGVGFPDIMPLADDPDINIPSSIEGLSESSFHYKTLEQIRSWAQTIDGYTLYEHSKVIDAEIGTDTDLGDDACLAKHNSGQTHYAYTNDPNVKIAKDGGQNLNKFKFSGTGSGSTLIVYINPQAKSICVISTELTNMEYKKITVNCVDESNNVIRTAQTTEGIEVGKTATINIADYFKSVPGYTLNDDAIKNVIVSKDETVNVVNFTYAKDENQTQDTKYTVKHVVGGEVRDSQEYAGTAWVGEKNPMIAIVDGSLNQKSYTGYEFEKMSVAENTTEVESGTTITLTYVKDAKQANNLSYTVKHVTVLDDEKTVKNTFKGERKDVWVNDAQTLELEAEHVTDQKYTGYTLQSVKAGDKDVKAGDMVDNDTEIVVTYVKDDTQTHSVSARVDYYKDGELAETGEVETAIGWIGEATTIELAPNTTGKFVGYKHDSTVGDLSYTVASNAATDATEHVVSVYYVKDDTQTHSATVNVEFYKGDSYDQNDANKFADFELVKIASPIAFSSKTWIGESVEVSADSIKAPDELEGYSCCAYDGSFKCEVAAGNPSNSVTLKMYYVLRSDLSFTVNYLEKGTTDVKLAESVKFENNVFGKEIKASSDYIGIPEIDGYTFNQEDNEHSIIIGIDNDKNVLNVYYTKRTDLSYTVKYLDEDDNALVDAKTETSKTFGETYEEAAEAVDGYTVDAETKSVTMTTGTNEIVFRYFKDKNGDEIADKYQVTFTYVTMDPDAGTVTGTTTEVATRYDEDGNLSETASVSPKADVVATANDGYWFVDWTDGPGSIALTDILRAMSYDKDTTFTARFMKQNNLSYTVKYLDEDDNALVDAKTETSKTFGETYEEAAEAVDGYTVDAETKSVTMTTGTNEIVFHYTKRTDLSYTVNYLEQDTDKVLADAKEVNGKIFKKSVTENAIDIVGYDKVDPASATITIEVEDNVINFYYTKASFDYTVNYLDEDGNAIEASLTAMAEFESEVVAEPVEIDGYVFDHADVDSISISATDTNVINLYYAVDELGTDPENPDQPDGVADKYQLTVEFAAVNGTINGASKVVLNKVDANGDYAEDGLATLTAASIPTATANEGYEAEGVWAPSTPIAGMTLADDAVFTISFDEITEPAAPEPPSQDPADDGDDEGDDTPAPAPDDEGTNPPADDPNADDGTGDADDANADGDAAGATDDGDAIDNPEVPISAPAAPVIDAVLDAIGDAAIAAGIPAPVAAPAAPAAPAPVAVAAPAPAAAPAAPLATIVDDGTPLAALDEETIDDDANALASFEPENQCWVHWLMILGIIITAFYGIGVVNARRKETEQLEALENQALGRRGNASVSSNARTQQI